jgi:uncharacterized protein YbjQ (UPF0145 family)
LHRLHNEQEELMKETMVTTALDLPGYEVVQSLGVVRGITVRSRSIVGNFFGALQSLFGGNITIYTNLCEQARSETYRIMCEHAQDLGANAIIAMRYDATELMAGLTEVLCYGTAVVVEANSSGA